MVICDFQDVAASAHNFDKFIILSNGEELKSCNCAFKMVVFQGIDFYIGN